MRLSTKHADQQTVSIYDFSGGLNTAASVSSIAGNELADVLNMELDSTTNCLKTVSGTRDVYTDSGMTIWAAAWDGINGKAVLVDTDRDVYITDFKTTTKVGTLTGSLYPICTDWEDGILIASGGKLQYYNGKTLDTLTGSPDSCKGVYVRSGRVLVFTDNEVHYSAVGDEATWTEDTNDYSASVWVEAGYKDGGKFVGMANLSQDIMIIKDNRRVYRLSGEYPDWTISEVSRNVECIGRRSFTTMAANVIILGRYEVQVITTSQDYGDVKPANIASKVVRQVASLPHDTIVRYVPPLQQIWMIGTNGEVLLFDTVHNAWFKRRFNSDVVDVLSVGDATYVIKGDRISQLDDTSFTDNGRDMIWHFQARQLVSQHDYLLKRTQATITPCSSTLYNGEISVGGVVIGLPVSARTIRVWHNYAKIHQNKTKLMVSARIKGVYSSGEKIYHDANPIYNNKTKLFNRHEITKESRNVYRSKFLNVQGRGYATGFVLNGLVLDIVEV